MSFTSASLQSRVGTCSCISSFPPPTLLCFCFPYGWLLPKSVRAENVTKSIAFPRSSCLLTVNAGDSVISLASGFSCWHISLIRRAMFTNLWRVKTHIRFSRESLLFNRIYRVFRIDGFPWNLARTCTDDYETKVCRRILLLWIFFWWQPLTHHVLGIVRCWNLTVP